MRPIIDFIRKVRRLVWRERLLLLEASLWLAVAGLAIGVLPFRHVGRLAGTSLWTRELTRQTRLVTVQQIRWAVAVCARRVPWRAMCFQQGLAAQLMLRWRGVPSVLYYGVTPDRQSGLAAHVWVRDGDLDVVGGEIASRFAVLATFPQQEAC